MYLAVVAGVNQYGGVVAQCRSDLVCCVLKRLVDGAYDLRTLPILDLHAGKVGMRIRLTIEQLIHKALFVVIGDIVAPPSKLPLISDGR